MDTDKTQTAYITLVVPLRDRYPLPTLIESVERLAQQLAGQEATKAQISVTLGEES